MRKFKLLNENGAVFDLMRTDAFFHAPNGLGISRSLNTKRLGDYASVIDSTLTLAPVSGEMIFEGYEQYDEFTGFITNTVTLSYCPREVLNGRKLVERWYYRDCAIATLEKSEIDKESGRLICPIEFSPLSPWYMANSVFISGAETYAGKRYTYEYPVTYDDRNAGEITLKNNGREPAPCCLRIYGPCINPSWTLAQDAVSVINGEISVTLNYDEVLVVDANPRTMEIAKYTADGGRTDVYQHSNFETSRFLYAPRGLSTLRVRHAGNETLRATVEVREICDSV